MPTARKKMQPTKPTETNEDDYTGDASQGGLYFSSSQKLTFFSTGCALFDCVLGGGWCQGRIINLVGDSGSSKTGIAVEACANFYFTYPSGRIWYNETEAAFDVEFAENLGLPTQSETFSMISDCGTIEELFDHLEKCADACDDDNPGLYIIDSLDAMTDQSESSRGIEEGTYGTGKSKKLSELFRRLNRKLNKSNMTVIFISQTRENIGVTFGEKYTRSGGKALRFYASQEVWLANVQKVKKTVKKIERPIGTHVRAQVKKLKVGMPFRTCDLEVIFAYGIDDLASNGAFLDKVTRLDATGYTDEQAKSVLRRRRELSGEEFSDASARFANAVRQVWPQIEQGFAPTRRKYR
jgi:recombination protein RecA